MALPTSGAIDLNAIHREAGGPSGGSVGINDADVRALIGKGSGASMGFNEWYGASNANFVIDEGSSGTNYGYSRVGGNYGSISGAEYWRGVQCLAIYTSYFVVKGSVGRLLIVRFQGNRAANWFNSVRVGGTTHTSGSFTRSYSGSTLWLKTITAAQMMNGAGNTSGRWT